MHANVKQIKSFDRFRRQRYWLTPLDPSRTTRFEYFLTAPLSGNPVLVECIFHIISCSRIHTVHQYPFINSQSSNHPPMSYHTLLISHYVLLTDPLPKKAAHPFSLSGNLATFSAFGFGGAWVYIGHIVTCGQIILITGVTAFQWLGDCLDDSTPGVFVGVPVSHGLPFEQWHQ